MHELINTWAKEGNDISVYLTKIKGLWNRISLLTGGDSIHLQLKLFKNELAYSLSSTWNDFTCQLQHDSLKCDMSVPQFIGECHKEYCQCQNHDKKGATSSYSGLWNPCNVWEFQIGGDVVPKGMGMALSVGGVKWSTSSWLQMVFRSCDLNEQLWRYALFKLGLSLQGFWSCWYKRWNLCKIKK